jgi:hypothetical protein
MRVSEFVKSAALALAIIGGFFLVGSLDDPEMYQDHLEDCGILDRIEDGVAVIEKNSGSIETWVFLPHEEMYHAKEGSYVCLFPDQTIIAEPQPQDFVSILDLGAKELCVGSNCTVTLDELLKEELHAQP